MTLELKRGLAVSAAAVAVFGGSGGAALACHGPGTATATATQLSFTTVRHEAIWHGTGIGTAVTSYLGLQPAQIRADLAAGQTLGQIADATPGKSASGLVSAIMGSLKTKLDAAVTAGKLSTTTESTILGNLNTKVNAVVNAQWRGWWLSHHRFAGHI